MNKPKFTPGYEVTPDGRVFSVASNWRGYGCRAPGVVADQAGGRAMSKNLRCLNKTAALRKRRGGKRGIRQVPWAK